ncbi:carbon-nitrogen hydrolase family protein [Aeoliella mucimassa]|uniref:(R)-stereoselective amidase n=1 Tax=Aeoliella mucimassa TaxID=2527972 RepID=A0A518AR56_9BACT|nr:carbon-nitrogen hydrolase family protein [Aeoliella mucimassa]QDU57211.1 (R)-stereoselective amidase [Aeoliella mucimassa]
MARRGVVFVLLFTFASMGSAQRAQAEEEPSVESATTQQSEHPAALRVAMCQLSCVDDDREGNFERLEACLKQAQRESADMACFPETCLLGWVNPNSHQLAHPIPGTELEHDVSRLQALAQQYELMLCLGLAEKSGAKLYDSVVLIDRDGKLLLKHRKVNVLKEMMTPPYTAGERVEVVDTPFGKIGLLICADTFDADCLQRMQKIKPDLVLVPYGWAAPPADWPQHGRALASTVSHAAKTIGAPVVGVNSVGEIAHGPWRGYTYGGQSISCDAEGRSLLVLADRQSQVITFELMRKVDP